MNMITSVEDFNNAKSRDLIKIECSYCNKQMQRRKNWIQASMKNQEETFCSKECFRNSKKRIKHKFNCKQCGKEVERNIGHLKSRKRKGIDNENYFCSQHCFGIYNTSHRTTGTRRSKLEIWLEGQLTKLYPNLKILYNDTSVIQAELDIYIPSLKLAFELNGIFHYEPIFGQEKLNDIKEKDKNKFAKCQNASIGLCIIDTSKTKYHKPCNAKQYLDIITNIIDNQ